ncbi:hypothetical protein PsorP6_003021 [Peronosclerospora sorghi]|uniref:Uncharacterized protein n=1 Tax=Peronosclerospora sorghi TaxID=230839 RepID=A0ACC0VR66_9STRA|nr:hypothetical protein PsorP6_003021 [Peronosclerospora sorghi]
MAKSCACSNNSAAIMPDGLLLFQDHRDHGACLHSRSTTTTRPRDPQRVTFDRDVDTVQELVENDSIRRTTLIEYFTAN